MKKTNTIFLMVLLLIFVRLYSVACYPADELRGETYQRGELGNDLLSRQIKPIFSYIQYPYEGGGLVMSILAVSFILIFGNNLSSVLFASILFSVSMLVSIFKFANYFFSYSVGIYASLLFIFAPGEYVLRLLQPFGNHCEAGLFGLFIIFLLLIFYAPSLSVHHISFFPSYNMLCLRCLCG